MAWLLHTGNLPGHNGSHKNAKLMALAVSSLSRLCMLCSTSGTHGPQEPNPHVSYTAVLQIHHNTQMCIPPPVFRAACCCRPTPGVAKDMLMPHAYCCRRNEPCSGLARWPPLPSRLALVPRVMRMVPPFLMSPSSSSLLPPITTSSRASLTRSSSWRTRSRALCGASLASARSAATEALTAPASDSLGATKPEKRNAESPPCFSAALLLLVALVVLVVDVDRLLKLPFVALPFSLDRITVALYCAPLSLARAPLSLDLPVSLSLAPVSLERKVLKNVALMPLSLPLPPVSLDLNALKIVALIPLSLPR
mmetsp:Transcript_7250/g.15817  ORF Transcript_7250/g.15817 Transcript_7250/m.15817 type:complete len:309 (+) Transcript_7250:837-1763(+)